MVLKKLLIHHDFMKDTLCFSKLLSDNSVENPQGFSWETLKFLIFFKIFMPLLILKTSYPLTL